MGEGTSQVDYPRASHQLNPVASEISDLLLFLSYFASQNKEIKPGN